MKGQKGRVALLLFIFARTCGREGKVKLSYGLLRFYTSGSEERKVVSCIWNRTATRGKNITCL